MALTKAQNLMLAQAAINHTKALLPLGAQNDPDNPRRDEADIALGFIRQEMAEMGGDVPLYRVAAIAKRMKAGNCGEQAATAFKFLKARGVTPLDVMTLLSGDHGWVVIGRLAGSDATDYRTWGAAAVVCDPWTPCCLAAAEWGGEYDMDDEEYRSVLRHDGPANPIVKAFEV